MTRLTVLNYQFVCFGLQEEGLRRRDYLFHGLNPSNSSNCLIFFSYLSPSYLINLFIYQSSSIFLFRLIRRVTIVESTVTIHTIYNWLYSIFFYLGPSISIYIYLSIFNYLSISACKKGNVEIVEYLISVCQADLEQRGQYEVSDDRYKYNTEQLSVSPSISLTV